MVKQDPDDVKREIAEQEDEFSGEGTMLGSSPDPDSDDDVAKVRAGLVGDDQGEVVSMADEVEKDNDKRRGK